ncbi:MAG: hypothetical protein GXP25_00390 [Planctomycetes bacterium]|nr:hypothetical protein [Planctomycetota bacterium]
MLSSIRLTKCLLAVIVLLLAAVAWTAVVGEKVAAQEGTGRFMIGVVGFWRDNSEPVFIIDTRKQMISIYEFDSEQNTLDLMAVRSYEYDRKLIDFPIRKTRSRARGRGPSVRAMMKQAGAG